MTSCEHFYAKKPNVFCARVVCPNCHMFGWWDFNTGEIDIVGHESAMTGIVACEVPKGPIQAGHVKRDFNKPDREILVDPKLKLR